MADLEIEHSIGRESLDSRGNPTVEAEVWLADGSIGSTFNFMYPHYRRIHDLFLDHRYEEALVLQVKANNIMNTLCEVGLIPAIKYVLSVMGIDAGIPRRPFRELTEAQKELTEAVLEENLVTA